MRSISLLLALLLLATPVHAQRLHTTGFEENDLTTATGTWAQVVGSPATTTTAPNTGTYALDITASAATEGLRKDIPANDTAGTHFFRFYFKYTTLPAADIDIARYTNNTAGNGLEIRAFDTAGAKRFRLRNNVTTTAQSCTNDLSSGTWYRIEASVLLSDTVGTMSLATYTGDSLSADCSVSITGEDTLATELRRFFLGTGTTTTATMFYDDFAWNDESGGFQTAQPGVGRIVLVKPVTDDTVTWTQNSCGTANNFDCVDDRPGASSDASFLSLTNTQDGNDDRFNLSTIPAGPDSDDDFILMDLMARFGGTSTTGTNTSRTSIWDDAGSRSDQTAYNGCDTTTWTIVTTSQHQVLDLGTDQLAAIQTYDIGVEGVTIDQTCRVSDLWANLEYQPVTAAGCGGSSSMLLLGAGCK